ncbi:MAG: hypothetical protein SCG81_03530 [Nitrosomonadaceae bacterium]|nr:hypothetical protein [Nitrosospira sp.]MDW7642552.1 hypothetical protein [Nitrosomonadaceae bacterium]MDW7653156.1 hypothetical protein [Nitrosomonadaceae bacterium]MDW7664142.1 hypothetical protein [Nitrosomonadaceae bacterium]MDW7665502.1 hypothetical protein [Nitrosomonadaceae bacterium]
MKLSLLTAALIAFTLTACERPKQALPASIDSYGTRTEEGTTMTEERGADYVGAGASPAQNAPSGAPVAAPGADEFSGKAVLPGHTLDGNGNPITDGKNPIPAAH